METRRRAAKAKYEAAFNAARRAGVAAQAAEAQAAAWRAEEAEALRRMARANLLDVLYQMQAREDGLSKQWQEYVFFQYKHCLSAGSCQIPGLGGDKLTREGVEFAVAHLESED
jgi:hypothetical protein